MSYSQLAPSDSAHTRAEGKANGNKVMHASGTNGTAGSDDVIPLLSQSMALYFQRSVGALAVERVDGGLKLGGGHIYDHKTSRQKVRQYALLYICDYKHPSVSSITLVLHYVPLA